MNPTVGNSRVSISVTMMVIIVMGLLAVSCTTGSPAETLAPSPVVIEREVVRTVVVEKPVVQEVTKLVEVVVTPTPMPPAATPTPHPDTRLVMDDTGREIEIPFRPERFAVTNSWMVEVLMACDYTPVARPHIPLEFVYPPAAHDIPIVAVSHSAGPNIEQLAAAQPDLVLTSPTYGRFAEPIQQALGVPVLIYNVDTVEDVLREGRDVGQHGWLRRQGPAGSDRPALKDRSATTGIA